MATTLQDITTRADIEHLVDTFYEQVLTDELIGFFFTEIAKLDMKAHMPTMYNFWDSMLLGSRTYEGNPMVRHIHLSQKHPLGKVHFDRWLELWEKTVRENFEGAKAEEAIERAKSIAGLMLMKTSS